MLMNLMVSAVLLLWGQVSGRVAGKSWQALTEEEQVSVAEEDDGSGTDTESGVRVRGEVDYLWIEEEQMEVRLRTEESGYILLCLDAPFSEEELPQIGNRLDVLGTEDAFREATVPGQYDERSYYESRGYETRIRGTEWWIIEEGVRWWPQKLWELRQAVREVYVGLLPEKEAGVLTAMILGDKSLLDPELNDLYQSNGISHLLSVSGLHVSLLGGVVLFLLYRVSGGRAGRLAAGCAAIFLVLSYGVLIDYPVSTKRAVLMMILSILAGMAGRTYDMPTALSTALLLVLVQDPGQAGQAGFQLSFGAVAGIGLLCPVLKQYRKGRETAVESSILVGVATLLMTLPIQMYHFHEISFSGLWNNLLVIPPMTILLLSGFAGGMMGLLPGLAGELLGKFALGSAYVILKFYEVICRLGEKLSWAVQVTGRPAVWQMVVYYGILAGIILWGFHTGRKGEDSRRKNGEVWWATRQFRGWLLRMAGLAAAVILVWIRFPENSVTMLDVGQGDGIVIRSGTGANFLMDCGSTSVSGVGQWRLLPYLKFEGIRQLDGVFVSHADQDHISGILELLEDGSVKVDRLFLAEVNRSQGSLQSDNYVKLLATAEKAGSEIHYLKPEDVVQDGEVSFRCLGPDVAGSYEDSNAVSLVLELEMQESRILLTGDMGETEEKRLVAGMQGDYDILKVAHHGSRYSSGEELLSWCDPEIALVSCSRRNTYGHPHPDTLNRIRAVDCQVFGTSVNGTIRITWDKNGEICLWHWK